MVSSMVTNYLIKASIIEEKQRELYEYSIKSLFGNVLNIVSCLAIGMLCGECVRAIIFLPDWFYLLMAGIGMGLISIIAPVDCIEKPMDMEDKKKMHIRVRYLIC